MYVEHEKLQHAAFARPAVGPAHHSTIYTA
jgi:hypothetical protein